MNLTFGERIADLRAAAGESMEEVAAAIGLSASNYSQLENNKVKKINIFKVVDLCNHFGVSIETLFPELPKVSAYEKERETAADFSGLSFEAIQALRNESKDPEIGTKPISEIISSDHFHRFNYVLYKAITSAANAENVTTQDPLPGIPAKHRKEFAQLIDNSRGVFLPEYEAAEYYADRAAAMLKEMIRSIAKASAHNHLE